MPLCTSIEVRWFVLSICTLSAPWQSIVPTAVSLNPYMGWNQLGQKLNVYFRGLLFTSHWLNLQHWTGFYIAVYDNFQGLFFIFEGSFLHYGSEIARSPHVISPLEKIPQNAPVPYSAIHAAAWAEAWVRTQKRFKYHPILESVLYIITTKY